MARGVQAFRRRRGKHRHDGRRFPFAKLGRGCMWWLYIPGIFAWIGVYPPWFAGCTCPDDRVQDHIEYSPD